MMSEYEVVTDIVEIEKLNKQLSNHLKKPLNLRRLEKLLTHQVIFQGMFT